MTQMTLHHKMAVSRSVLFCLLWLSLSQGLFTSSIFVEGKKANSTKDRRPWRITDAITTTMKRQPWPSQLPKYDSTTTNRTLQPVSTTAAPITRNDLPRSTPQNRNGENTENHTENHTAYPVTDTNLKCYSTQTCSQKCSNETTFDRFNEAGSMCSCDRACSSVFMDCCVDYAEKCATHEPSHDDFDRKHRTLMHCETKLNIIRGWESIKSGVWMVTKCPSNWPNDVTRARCQTPSFKLQVDAYNSYIPVLNELSKLTYRNKYCALCNNVSQYDFWNLLFSKESLKDPSLPTIKGSHFDFESFLKVNVHDFIGLRPKNRWPIRYCHFPNTVSSCPNGTSDVNIDACINGDVRLVQSRLDGRVYKNQQCALCNEVKNACGVGGFVSTSVSRFEKYLEINVQDNDTIPMPCPQSKIYDRYVGKCRRNIKKNWKYRKNATTDIYQVILILNNTLTCNFSKYHDNGNLLRKDVSRVIKMNESQISNEEIIRKTSEIVLMFTVSLTPVQSVIAGMQTSRFKDFGLKKLFPMFDSLYLEFSVAGFCTIYGYHFRQLACIRQRVYSSDEYDILGAGREIYIHETKAIYKPSEYYKTADKGITVCLEVVEPLSCSNGYVSLKRSRYHILPRNLTLVHKSSRYDYGYYSYKKGRVQICSPLVITRPRLVYSLVYLQKSVLAMMPNYVEKKPIIYELPFEKNAIFSLPNVQLSVYQRVYSYGEFVELGDQLIYVNATNTFYKQGEYYRNSTDEKSNVTVSLQEMPFQCNFTFIKLTPSEYQLENQTLFHKSTDYKREEYVKTLNGTVFVCVQNNVRYTRVKLRTKMEDALGFVTIVGFVLSLVSLSALIVTYSFFEELRTLPGKNILSLSISLFLALLLWLCGRAFQGKACVILAIANHYSFLVSFAASSAIAFHSSMILGKEVHLRRTKAEDNKTFLVYVLLVWGMPALFVMATVLLDYFGLFVTNYGSSDLCWLGTYQSKLFLFFVPIGVLLLCNVLLFGFSALRFLKNQNSIARNLGKGVLQKRQCRNILICVKLSTLMGFSWLFGLLLLFVKSAVFAYLFVIFVSFQGFFISVAFLFKRRCMKLYRGLWASKFSRKTTKQKQHSSGTPRGTMRNTTRETRL